MKNLIKIYSIVALCAFLLLGCNTINSAQKDNKLSVVTTIFPQYDFVREIAGDNVNLSMLLKPGSESHSYEPTPKDIITIQNCDVFIYVGGESEKWAEDILDSIDTKNIKIISLMECVDIVEEEIVYGMEHEHEDDVHHEDEHSHDEEIEYDEHVWTSPKNAIKIVNQISAVLSSLDEKNKDKYNKNTKEYITKLEELDSLFKSIINNSSRKTLVFGDRFPFRYFADAYGLDYYAAFPGCSTETEASAATVSFLINKVKDDNIPVVFYIELSNEKMADTICEATGAKKLLLHSCHNITKKDFDNGISYLDLMEVNANNLVEALK